MFPLPDNDAGLTSKAASPLPLGLSTRFSANQNSKAFLKLME